jgi:fructose-1,6-bisphosphatase/inositol monophosphatase family enzyme
MRKVSHIIERRRHGSIMRVNSSFLLSCLIRQGSSRLVVRPNPYSLDLAASAPAIVQAGSGPK